MLRETLEPEFVRFVPERLQPGVLYVSMEFATASHLCCCGCGSKVVTPFTPTDWRMTFDGETVTLNPSVGNWEQRCQSHYVIDRNRVVEHGPWSKEDVRKERTRDHAAKRRHYGAGSDDAARRPAVSDGGKVKTGLWGRLRAWLRPS